MCATTRSNFSVIQILIYIFALTSALQPPNVTPPPGIIESINIIRVPYGRSVYLNPLSDLRINVADGDYCSVRVLPRSSSRLPGFVSPQNFPCNFGPKDVKYIHLGSESPSTQKIRLQVRYDSPTETYIIPTSLQIEILYVERTVILKSQFLTVPKLMGDSEIIDRNVLTLSYNSDYTCQLTTTPYPEALKQYGILVNDPSQGIPVPCDDFFSAGVYYHHIALTDSPRKDKIPMVVKLFDAAGNQIAEEYFQITVKLLEGKDNTPPMLDFSATMMIEVDQFVMTAITPDIVKGQDVESDPGDLVFNITRPLLAHQGEFVSTDHRNQKISSFFQADVNDLRIAYKPPNVDSNQLRVFEVEMQIIDTEGAQSEPFNLILIVKPMNTNSPVVVRNTGQLLYQGQSRTLSTKNLEISDEDNLEDVEISVVSGLAHGYLLTNGGKTFSPADLNSGSVMYKHDGSNTFSDNIIFRMTDGEHNVEFLFPITVAIIDNTPPVLDANTGLTINKGSTEIITTWILSAADIDSEDSDLKFVLHEPYSKEGQFLLISESPMGDQNAWNETSDGRWEKEVFQFYEANLLSMQVYYRSIGNPSDQVVMDRVKLHVEDNSVPPNVSPIEEFIIKILPVDDIPPHVHRSATLQMDVNEFELTIIDRKSLRYSDEGMNDKKIVFTLTSPITDLSTSNQLQHTGNLVLTDHPGRNVISFSQSQINHHKVSYKPPDIELGVIARELQFMFNASDNEGNVLTDQLFLIFLRTIDNKQPQIVNNGFAVHEGNTKSITPDILDAKDVDTEDEGIKFNITTLPNHGLLYHDDIVLNIGSTFTREEIKGLHITYGHNGDESTYDEFSLEISDEMHSIPVVVKVTILRMDDLSPIGKVPLGSLDFQIDVAEHGTVAITSEVLSAIHLHADDLVLNFLITTLPSKGHVSISGQPVNSFTLENVQKGQVAYIHTSGEIGMLEQRDSFRFTISDLSDDLAIGRSNSDMLEMNVRILPVNNQEPMVVLGDDCIVNEGGISAIELRHLTANDEDSNNDDITCLVLIQPEYGFLENISPAPGSEKSREGIRISSFSIADIRMQSINYVQNFSQGIEPIKDKFSFACQDGSSNTSPSYIFNIAINPVNDEKPTLYYSELVVEEGGALFIDRPRLDAEDLDVPEDSLTFTITQRPKHGDILFIDGETSSPADTFLLSDVATSSIVYEHDNTESTHDAFEILLSDGEHEVKQIIPIKLIHVDDETPQMMINNGLDTKISESKVISNKILKATDLDSDDSSLLYIITYSPHLGNLTRMNALGDMIEMGIGDNFTQKDIGENKIAYVHTGQEGVRDLLKFDVTDGINSLIDQYFFINIDGMDMLFPTIRTREVMLKEGGHVTLTTDILSTDDLDSPDEDLEFTIVHVPTRGHLESTDMPGILITKFRQLDLAGNKIQYVHTSMDEIKMDSFEFEVSDGFNHVYRTLRITILDVDNKIPVVTVNKLHLEEGKKKLITPFEIKVEDGDTPERKLKIIIKRVPVHGKILLNDSTSNQFTVEDLDNNLVTYAHDGSETVSDSFTFVITDGTHDVFYVFPDTVHSTRMPQQMSVQILPVDNSVPQILINRGVSAITELASGNYGYRITKTVLEADDLDSDSSSLLYVVTKPAQSGYLINVETGETPIKNFTQGDINKLNIFYILNQRSNATDDEFKFKLVDNGGNELKDNSFSLKWATISLSSANYSGTEEDSYLLITLQRLGFLGETSFVSISVFNGTAKAYEDFQPSSAKQVQFNPGESEASWKLYILPDESYEQSESFYIVLSEPVMGILKMPKNASVIITDAEDESSVSFRKESQVIQENIGEFSLSVHRKGDLSQELTVICHTERASATGTIPTTVTSFSDYISRPKYDLSSLLIFGKGESTKPCRIVIIDDSLYEDNETFLVKLAAPSGGRLGKKFQANITIAVDLNDEPVIYFEDDAIEVDESDGEVGIAVKRIGTDLTHSSFVVVQSQKNNPESAKANEDYIGISETLTFAPGVTMQHVHVTILDDFGRPILEGEEIFHLVLRMASSARLGKPNRVKVSINDSYSDLPLVQFSESTYEINEDDETLEAKIVRSGDLSHISSVRCYTRQASAEVMIDYLERPNTDLSVIRFNPGQSVGHCVVAIRKDNIYEGTEEFRLILGSASSESAGEALIGEQDEAVITIVDETDRPFIGFSQSTYEVTEPGIDDVTTVSIMIRRHGDLSHISSVRFFTKNGNAESGKDYNPLSTELVFGVNISSQIVNLEILHDDENEIRESFTAWLEPDSNMIADLGRNHVIIYIKQEKILADVTFPLQPSVISLLDYDNIDTAVEHPSSGYPVICVTPCNPKHNQYAKVKTTCTSEGIDDKKTRFRWLIAEPNSFDNVTNTLREGAENTFFTNTTSITLDSIYFKAGSRLACVAQPVTVHDKPGIESRSKSVTVSTNHGMCPPYVKGSFGAEPFSSHIQYTGALDKKHPHLIKISVSMPHIDGMLPAISTRRLDDFDISLSQDISRLINHRCSNLLNYNESVTNDGFLFEAVNNAETYPYQSSATLRSNKTLNFYRNLNLAACVWQFNAYYSISELLSECGGEVKNDGQVLNDRQSYVSIRVPLYVSYVFHSSVGKGWQHFDQKTELDLTFVYDTAILWQNGIGSTAESKLQGYLYPTNMHIQEHGKLVVNFRTEARFQGQFVINHINVKQQSTVTSLNHPELPFSLNLIRSQASYNQPEQQWSFISEYAILDYSGKYTLKLLPCTTSVDQMYTQPPICNPRERISFDMNIRFQQVSDPVPTEFSLNTNFFLLSKRSLWLSEGVVGFDADNEVAFDEDANIYGRVIVDPLQNLGSVFDASIEQVYICSGLAGYIPKYNPQSGEYGCLAETPRLLHRYKVLDKDQPNTQDVQLNNIPFNAKFALDDPEANQLVQQPGTDGFQMNSKPLFMGNVETEWYMHAVYKVKAKDRTRRTVSESYSVFLKTSQTDDSSPAVRSRRSESLPRDVGMIGYDYNRGTNMRHLMLDRSKRVATFIQKRKSVSQSSSASSLHITVIGIVSALLVLGGIIGFIIVGKKRLSADNRGQYSGASSVQVAFTDDCGAVEV